MLFEANMNNPTGTIDARGTMLQISPMHTTLFEGGGGLHVNCYDGKVTGVGNLKKCAGVPTTFGRHCLIFKFKEGG